MLRLLKFGGKTLNNPDQVANCVECEVAKGDDVIMLLSALEDVTKGLRGLMLQQTHEWHGKWRGKGRVPSDFFNAVHRPVIEGLGLRHSLGDAHRRQLLKVLDLKNREIASRVEAAQQLPKMDLGLLDQTLPIGEEMAREIVATVLEARGFPVVRMDSRQLIRSDHNFGAANILWRQTRDLTRREYRKKRSGDIWVIQGFSGGVWVNGKRWYATLGPNSTDTATAAIASVLKPEVGSTTVIIYKEVPGVMSADPQLVPDAVLLRRAVYAEVEAAGNHAARVVEPRAVGICEEAQIPIEVRDFMHPETPEPGTLISNFDPATLPGTVRILAHIDTTIVQVRGKMRGLVGTMERVARAFTHVGANMRMVAQGSNEHCIEITTTQEDAQLVEVALHRELHHELHAGEVGVRLIEQLPVVAAISAKMRGIPGVLGKLGTATGEIGVSIESIVQNTDQANMCFCVHRADVERTLQAIHRAFEMDKLS